MLALDPRTTALVLIDLQKGVLAMPLAPHGAAQVVQNAARLGLHFDEVGAVVALVHVAFSDKAVDRLSQPVDAPPAPAALPADWADFAPEIGSLHADIIITKRQWGAFYGTDLDLQLRRRGLTTIILCGIATEIGVESTARDAYERGCELIFASDAMTGTNAESHLNSVVRIFPRMGRVRSTEQIVAALQS